MMTALPPQQPVERSAKLSDKSACVDTRLTNHNKVMGEAKRKRDPDLDAFLRLVSRHAEQIFGKHGELELYFMIQMPDEIITMIAPEGTRGGSPAKSACNRDHIAVWLRGYLREHGAERYAVISEMWTTTKPVPPGHSISEQPDRTEEVMIHVEDGTRALTGVRDIIRPAGRKAYLGKLEKVRDIGIGRFSNLLARDQS
jgi:hypothetical protein